MSGFSAENIEEDDDKKWATTFIIVRQVSYTSS